MLEFSCNQYNNLWRLPSEHFIEFTKVQMVDRVLQCIVMISTKSFSIFNTVISPDTEAKLDLLYLT